MAEFTLKRSEEKTLRINVGDDSFEMPLQGSLTWKEALSLETPQGTYAFLKKYIPDKVFNDLKVEEYNAIVEAWKTESLKHTGKTSGES